jgi:hypothetical protein
VTASCAWRWVISRLASEFTVSVSIRWTLGQKTTRKEASSCVRDGGGGRLRRDGAMQET